MSRDHSNKQGLSKADSLFMYFFKLSILTFYLKSLFFLKVIKKKKDSYINWWLSGGCIKFQGAIIIPSFILRPLDMQFTTSSFLVKLVSFAESHVDPFFFAASNYRITSLKLFTWRACLLMPVVSSTSATLPYALLQLLSCSLTCTLTTILQYTTYPLHLVLT